MRRQLLTLSLVALAGCSMLNEAKLRRQLIEHISSEVSAVDRYIDARVVLKTVVADPNGQELLEGKPRMRVLREQTFGGVIDTQLVVPAFVERPPEESTSRDPLVWFASEDQEAVVLHADPQRLGQLVYGSEGAGKTAVLAMWHYFRWLDVIGEGREGGQTAPTEARLEHVVREMRRLYAPDWYRFLVAANRVEFCDGTRIQLVSTKRQSAAQGSPIQGYNWSWCGRDEAQDSIDVHEDIESRGRSARDGRYSQLATATAKDNTDWRNLRDQLLGSNQWQKRQLSIFRSPFIDPSFLANKKATISDREFRRRYGAEDLPPERAVYPSYEREHNLIRVSETWEDVTKAELARWGHNLAALVGYDPGTLHDVSLVLKAYRRAQRARPIWVVVDEVTTDQTTTEQHVAELLKVMRQRHGLNLLTYDGKANPNVGRMMVRADPYGNQDAKPDRSIYTIFRNAGILIHPAAYNDSGSKPGRIPKEGGIDLVNTLLCNALGERRLFIGINEHGLPLAPNLVKSIEASERDSDGKAESQRKDKHDLSHWTAALRYALWAVERPRLQAIAGGQA